MGPSGSGKTTLLNLLGGLDVPSAGSITVAGRRDHPHVRQQADPWRARHVGFVFQMYNLIPVLTAFQNVELPLLLTKLSKAERRKHVETALGVVGLEIACIITRGSFPADRSSAWESRAPSLPTRPFCCATSRRAIWTARAPTKLWSCSELLVGQYGKTVLMVTHDPACRGPRAGGPAHGKGRAGRAVQRRGVC